MNPRKRKINNTRPVRRKLFGRRGEKKRETVSVSPIRSKSLKHALFLPVGLADGWNTGEGFPPANHRVTKHHEKATDDGKVAEEEGRSKIKP